MIFRDGTYARWTDDESFDIKKYQPYHLQAVYKYNDSGSKAILELRCDDVGIDENDTHIAATRENNTTNGATETISVRFDV